MPAGQLADGACEHALLLNRPVGTLATLCRRTKIGDVATIADVARAANVSIATVSRVLSPGPVPHPVRADTADRVRAAARRLNFVPSPLARGLAARRSGLVGLVVPDLADPHYPQIAVGVEDRAREAEMGVLICNTLGEIDRMSEYLQLLEARRVDVIVLSGATNLNAVQLQTLQRYQTPMVLIGRPAMLVQWPHVSIDNRLGARLATAHLVQIGCKRIVHLSGPRTQTTMADRARGYADEMVGLEQDIVESNGTPEDGYERLHARLSRPPAPDGVFAATDRLAVAALALAADRSLHVPQEFAVIGFDDIPLAGQLRPSLSTVSQPAHELGSVAVDIARGLVAGEVVEPKVLLPHLIQRQSTLGPGGRFTP
jgi:LacI family transcriptional regulator